MVELEFEPRLTGFKDHATMLYSHDCWILISPYIRFISFLYLKNIISDIYWSDCLDFIYLEIPFLPARYEPLIAIFLPWGSDLLDMAYFTRDWIWPRKGQPDSQSWEWRVNPMNERHNYRGSLWMPAVKIPRLLWFSSSWVLVLIMSLHFVHHLRILLISSLYD